MALVGFLLGALKYPRVDGFSAADPAQLQAAVVWLENTKVRRYPIDGRGALQSPEPATFRAALARYLADLECPLQLAPGGEPALLQWLLQHAVGLEYQDQPAQLNAAAARAEEEAGPPEEWSEAQLPPLADITAEGVRAALLQLQRALHVEGGAAGSAAAAEASPEGLQKAHAMLETCVLPALAELEKQRHPRAGGGAAAQQQQGQQGQQGQQAGGAAGGAGGSQQAQHVAVGAMLAQYPLGFSTGDGPADLAATILRMLYIKDLRQLQTLVDSAIVQVQEYTANPRTDATLGKVGW